MDVKRTENEPHDPLTYMANEMLRKLDEMGGEKMRAVVLISDEGRAGTAIHGFESDNEAVALLFAHLMAIFEANGQKLMIMPIGQG